VRVRPHWLIIDGVQPNIPENTAVDAPRPNKRPKLQQSKEKQQAKGKVPAAPAAEQAPAPAQVPAQVVKQPVQLLVSKELLQYWDRVVAVLKGTHPLVQVSWAAAGGRPRELLLSLRRRCTGAGAARCAPVLTRLC
jgi:hypothetical protein